MQYIKKSIFLANSAKKSAAKLSILLIIKHKNLQAEGVGDRKELGEYPKLGGGGESRYKIYLLAKIGRKNNTVLGNNWLQWTFD